MANSYRVSLDNSTRNRRAKGGFFVSCVVLEVQADGRFSATDAENAADAAEYLINGVATASGMPVGVWSCTESAFYAINRIRVGRRPDTQRRRQNNLFESYVERLI